MPLYTEGLQIEGSQDEVQVIVQGVSGQTLPLQTWEDDTATELARVTADGRFQNGDMSLSTADALIEAHRDSSSNLPKRGFHSLGQIASALSDAVSWLVAELELLGTGAISGLHRTLRIKLSHSSTGDSSTAELRAGDFELINQSGSISNPLGKALALQGSLDNQTEAYLAEAVVISTRIQNATDAEIGTAKALEVQAPVNDGTIDLLIGLDIADMNEGTDNYAIRTGDGKVQFGVLNTGLVKANSNGLLSNATKGTDFDTPMVGANGTVAGQAGIVPQPAATDNGKFLRGDGTWAQVSMVAALNDLTDVDTTGASSDEVLTFDGTNWVPQAVVIPESIPAGIFMPFGGSSTPSGWLLCNGATVSRSTYAALFAAIGTAYGVGDGSTTFHLPDMRGRVAVGAGQGSGLTNRTLGGSFGEENHQLTESEMPSHTHDNTVHEQSSTTFASNQFATLYAREQQTNRSGDQYIVPTGGDAAHNNMQPSLVVNYIIKT